MKYYTNRQELDEIFKKLYLVSTDQKENYDELLYLKLRAFLFLFANKKYITGLWLTNLENERKRDVTKKIVSKYPLLKEFPHLGLLLEVVADHNEYALLGTNDIKFIHYFKHVGEHKEHNLNLFNKYYAAFPDFCFSDIFTLNYVHYDLTDYLTKNHINLNVYKFDWTIVYEDLPAEIQNIFLWGVKLAYQGYGQQFEMSVYKKTGMPFLDEAFEDNAHFNQEEYELSETRLYTVVDFIEDVTRYLEINFKEKNYMDLTKEDDFEFYFDIFKALLLMQIGFEGGPRSLFWNDHMLVWRYLLTSSPYSVYKDTKKLFYAINFYTEPGNPALWFGRPFNDKSGLCDLLVLTKEMEYIAIKVNIDDNISNSINKITQDTINYLEKNLISELITINVRQKEPIELLVNYSSAKRQTDDWNRLTEERIKTDHNYIGFFPKISVNNDDILTEKDVEKFKNYFVDPTLNCLDRDIQMLYRVYLNSNFELPEGF